MNEQHSRSAKPSLSATFRCMRLATCMDAGLATIKNKQRRTEAVHASRNNLFQNVRWALSKSLLLRLLQVPRFTKARAVPVGTMLLKLRERSASTPSYLPNVGRLASSSNPELGINSSHFHDVSRFYLATIFPSNERYQCGPCIFVGEPKFTTESYHSHLHTW
jgi:hypothetical protein